MQPEFDANSLDKWVKLNGIFKTVPIIQRWKIAVVLFLHKRQMSVCSVENYVMFKRSLNILFPTFAKVILDKEKEIKSCLW